MSRSGFAVAVLTVCLAAGCLGGAARAQIVPQTIENEAERQRREIERQTAPQRQRGPGVIGPQAGPKLEFPAGGASVLLTRIEFTESRFLSAAELDAIRARHVGQRVDLAAIGRIVQSVNDLYAEKGQITASAVLPPQKLDGGVLWIRLVEGRVGKVSVTGAVQTWPWYVRSQVPIGDDDVVDAPALNRSVSIFNRLNEVQLRAQLGAGASFGLTDIELSVTEPPRNVVQLSYDNQGVTSTGRYQGILFLRHHNLLGIDDRLVLYGSRARGSILGNGSYTLPVSPWGTRLGASFTRSAYRIVNGAIRELRPEGISESSSLTLSQPVFATDSILLQATAALGTGAGRSKQLDIATVESSYSRVQAGASLSISLPALNHSSTANWSQVAHEDKISGRNQNSTILTGNTTSVWRLNDNIYGTLVGAWQYTGETQLPGDQIFQIGGPTTVRGYPIGAAFGNSGFYGQAELHYLLPDPLKQLEAFVFLDHGITYPNVVDTMRATSVGAGLIWRPIDWATLEGGFGRPLERISTVQRDVELYFRLTLRKSI
ncbi:ShlB/FhaC/HecB family hemolysin secretion/activation protein [Bosea sp. BH3]|uniref:ShlB/FhaC/HecB family hemolysin secretion/activation protein n=1 Tax=Bosea sp. BH3 TaxID=2871701 RepID=UPI0021CB1C91|nr:ShlB/FhaC/HecB family hemolysin secretion/activation protein [Bosea sp. BH3]MCU4179931.1 BamA/TamA family outer membrane protein [Bosea sp. BH3]